MSSHHTSSTESSPTHAITARNPDDLLAAIPVLLGFTPTESVVMLTLTSEKSFHARIDLPRSLGEQQEVIEMLLAPVLAHGVGKVVFVVYASNSTGVRALIEELCSAFEDHGVYVVEALHADGRCWFPGLPGIGIDAEGVAYDDRTNPISLQAVVDGHLMFASRDELAANLRGDEASVSAVASHLTPVKHLAPRQVPAEAAWATALIHRHLDAKTWPGDGDTARLLRALNDLRIRDAAWCLMTPENAKGLVIFWTGVVRKSPRSVLAPPATLLAFSAWLSGRGALAWCALDRSRESDPDYSLAILLARMLDRAVPPSAWVPPNELISELTSAMAAQPGSGSTSELA